jgi:ADP-ribose pyrophosphatase
MAKDKKIFEGKLLKLYSRTVRLPNGFKAGFEVIKHPGAALIIPCLTIDSIIMLKQLRPVVDKYLYELPAGTRNKGETPAACAAREIIEETGFEAGKLTRLGMIYPVPGYSTERIDIYKAEKLSLRPFKPEQDEVLQSLTMKRPQVKRLFKAGRIVDAKTICALSFIGWLS